ncbi:MAG: cysteine hydrolase family protein [Desulfobacterales bacterium]
MKDALILVDIQKDYFPGGAMELAGMEQAVQKASLLLDRFRKEKRPVFHVQHLSLRPGAAFFLPNTKGAEIHESVLPAKDEIVVQKHFPNSFRETGLLDHLRKAEVRELVFCGAMSHMCIDATVRAAFDLDFSCTVIADACATRDLEFQGMKVEAANVHAAFMAALAAVYAKVISAEQKIPA